MPALAEDSEDDGVVLRRSSRQNKPTAKVAERNATNLRNQRIQSAYIAAAKRLGGVQRTTCEQIVRSLQVQFPALRTKDVHALHRLLKKQCEMRTMEEGKLPGETDAEFTERWNAPENVDARAFNKRWYERSIRPTCEVCQLELGQDQMTYVQRKAEEDGTYSIADETLQSLYETVECAINSRVDKSTEKEQRHWLTYKACWEDRMRSGGHQWVCHKCVHQFEAYGDEERRMKRRRTGVNEDDDVLLSLPDNASTNHLWPGVIPVVLKDLNRTELSMIALINPVISYVCLGGYKGNPQVCITRPLLLP